MSKLIGMVLVILLCSVLCSVSCDAKEPIYIGLSAPITGQYSTYGDNFKKAIDLAIDEINKEGGIDGRLIELIVEDSQGVPKVAKRIARKFTADTRIVAEIGDFTSSCSMAAAPIYQKGAMVQLSPTASHPSFAPASPFSFSIAGTQVGLGAFMARTAVTRLHKKKLAVLYINNDWGITAQKFFIEEAERLGAAIVAVESYFEGTTDFTEGLTKLRTSQPELLYLCSMAEDGAIISKQRQTLEWNDVAVMGPGPLYTQKFLDLAGDASENVYTSAAFFPQDPRPEIQNFVTAYERRYNSTPNLFAAFGYDAMNLLSKAIQKAGTDRQAIRDAMSNIREFPGVTGIMTFTEHGDVVKERSLVQVKNGEFILYTEK